MKKINLLFIALLFSSVVFAQKLAVSDVPVQLTTDLKTRFPSADKVLWIKDNAIVKVNFINDGSNMELAYQNNNWQYSKWFFSLDFAPQKIKDYNTQYYVGYKMKSLSFVDKSSGERIYEVVLAKKKKADVTLIFDSSNNFLRVEGEVKKPEEVKKTDEIKKAN